LAWAIGSIGWLFWWGYFLIHTAAAIACGYPEIATKSYPICVASRLEAGRFMYLDVYLGHWYWALPSIALIVTGIIVAKRADRKERPSSN
jgi:hypothetical protein